MKKIFLGILFFLFAFSAMAILPSTPQLIVYNKITNHNLWASDCSATSTNRNSGENISLTCEYCRCLGDFANFLNGYNVEDIIETNICIYNETDCRVDTIKLTNRENIFIEEFDVTSCTPQYSVIMSFSAYKDKDRKELSDDQGLFDFKEDDYLFIDSIAVENADDCAAKGWYITFSLFEPNRDKPIPTPFSISRLQIPPLRKGEIYQINWDENSYAASVNDEIFPSLTFRGRERLFSVGSYRMEVLMKKIAGGEESRETAISINFLDKNGEIEDSQFKVRPKGEKTLIDDTKIIRNLTVVLLWLTFIMTLIGVIQIKAEIKKMKKIKQLGLEYKWFFGRMFWAIGVGILSSGMVVGVQTGWSSISWAIIIPSVILLIFAVLLEKKDGLYKNE